MIITKSKISEYQYIESFFTFKKNREIKIIEMCLKRYHREQKKNNNNCVHSSFEGQALYLHWFEIPAKIYWLGDTEHITFGISFFYP